VGDRPAIPIWLTTLVAFAAVLVVWQIAGETLFQESRSIPPPTDIIRSLVRDPGDYWDNLSSTLQGAGKGWVIGNALALGLAIVALVLPFTERPIVQLGVTSYCLPAVAIAPLLATVFDKDTPKVILAALAVFFTTLVGALVGLRSADPTSLDVIHAFGGSNVDKVVKVRLRAALPSLFAGLRIAAPAAVLGAIVGEYAGAEDGVGVAMLSAQASLNGPAIWTNGLVATAAAAAAYGLTALVGRLLTPWAPRTTG
jgi:ABC-type nitrate/sulfonate/bicarbonate transport system permease component